MAILTDGKTIGAPFSNESQLVRIAYNFANDAGAIADITALTADGSLVVKFVYGLVKVACTSGGSATVSLGKGAAGTEFMSAVAVASLTLDSVHVSATPVVELTNGEVISMGTAVATLLTGEIELVFEVLKK